MEVGSLLRRFETLDDYVAAGGGDGLDRALTLAPEDVVALIADSGLRGRGGAGFPTGTKWRSIRATGGERFVVCNAAEGEPATFKDRLLLRHNPYAVIEGMAIAARVVDAQRSYIGLKASFTLATEAVERALAEMRTAGMLDGIDVEIVRGPDRYLFGEETGLLGVIEGRGPYPREVRPFMQGLFGSTSAPNPTLENNAETLANVPAIVARGPEWFRSVGTATSPGTMLFTVVGDVVREGVFELPLGTPLRHLLEVSAGGAREGRTVKAVLPGASNAVLTSDMVDVPLDFDALRHAGSGLGAGGFAVYDDSACMVEVARQFSRFLHVESCGQCPPCKLHSAAINETFTQIAGGSGTAGDLETIVIRADRVTDGQKCALPTGTKLVVLGLVQAFAHEFASHAAGECELRHDLPFPKIVDHDEEAGAFLYDRTYERTNPQWMKEEFQSAATEA